MAKFSTMQRPSPQHLLILGRLGACFLWGVAFFNGTLDNMNAAIAKGFMPNGRALRSSYTGYDLIDKRVTYLTAFYEVLSNGSSSGPRLLFFNINFVISTTNAWVFIESRRRGVRNMALRHPIPWMILWNGLGAAFIQPFYFYLHTQSSATLRDPTIPYNEAIALFVTTIPAVCYPLLLFVPTWLGMSTWEHHGYIGAFFGSPWLIVFTAVGTTIILAPRYGLVSKKRSDNPNEDKPWVIACFIAAGVIAAAVHLYTVLGVTISPDPDISFTRLFVPVFSKVNSQFPTMNITIPMITTGLPAEYRTLLEGYHLFTQFDWIIVALACIVFTHYLLDAVPGQSRKIAEKLSSDEARDLGYLVLASIAVGPAAAGSFTLAVRESRLRETTDSRKIQ